MTHIPGSTPQGLGFSVSPSFWENLPDLVGAGAGAATTIINQTRQPYAIPGTGGQLIYAPLPGSITTPTGATFQNIGQGAGFATAGMTPILLLAGGALLLFVLMKK